MQMQIPKYTTDEHNNQRTQYKKETEDFIKKTSFFSGLHKANIYEKISEIIPKSENNYKNFQRIESLIKGGYEYEDTSFPHSTQEFKKHFKNLNLENENIKFSRISDLANGSKKCTLFNKVKVSKNKLPILPFKGNYQKTYLFTVLTDALCSLSTQPGLVLRIIDNDSMNKNGVYSTWIFKNYEWKNVLIDDFIPVHDSHHFWVPIFTMLDPNNVEIWQFLLEKTYAKTNPKFYDSYLNEIGIDDLSYHFKDIIRELTGGIVSGFKIKDIDILSKIQPENIDYVNNLWTKVTEALNEGHLVEAIPRFEGKNYEKFVRLRESRKGLNLTHCYSILKMVEITKYDGDVSLYLVKLKTAWSDDQWSGEWGRNWYQWTPELKAMVDYREDEADLWMTLKDFIRFFGEIVVCRTRVGYSHYNLKINFPHKKVTRMVLRLSYETEGKEKAYITLFQEKMRNGQYSDSASLDISKDENNEEKNFPDVKIVLGKFHDGYYRFLSYCNSVNSDTATMSKNLISGEYFILIEFVGDFLEEVKANLAIHAKGTLGMSIVENEEESVVYDFIHYKTWLYYAERTKGYPMSEIALASKDEEGHESEPIRLQLSKLEIPGCAIFCIQNPSVHLIRIEVNFDGTDDMEVLGFKGLIKELHNVLIDPSCKEIFILRHKRGVENGEFDEEIPKFKLGCSNLEIFYPPKPEDEKDMLVYEALIEDKPKHSITGLEIILKNQEEVFERQIEIRGNIEEELNEGVLVSFISSEKSKEEDIQAKRVEEFNQRKLSIQRSLSNLPSYNSGVKKMVIKNLFISLINLFSLIGILKFLIRILNKGEKLHRLLK